MSKEFELRVINKPMYFIELVALLHRMVQDRSYNNIQLKSSEEPFLDLLKGFRLKGLELFELFLYDENIIDIHSLKVFLANIDHIDFLYLLFGEELSREEIEHIKKRIDIINEIPKVKKYMASYDDNSISFVFQRTKEFIDGLFELFKALDTEVQKQLEDKASYKEAISEVSSSLRSKLPLDVAQSMMGKKFVRVYDFSTYYFVPSYFYMNRPMRTFNRKTQVLIYPIQEVNVYDKNSLVNALKVISDSTRLEIIKKLALRPMYGKELAQELGLVTSTVSHHLEQLRSIGLVHEERDKSVKYFSLNINEYNKLCDTLKGFIE